MKKFRVLTLVLALLMVFSVLLTACDQIIDDDEEDLELIAAKAALVEGLENYYNDELLAKNVYTAANKTILAALLAGGKLGINAATTIDLAQTAFETAKSNMDAVEVDPLPSAISRAKSTLSSHLAQRKALYVYTTAQLAILDEHHAAGIEQIDKATSLEAVEVALQASINLINSIVGEASFTYNTYTSVSPSNWNELTYQDSNDTQIMSYIGSNFFEYNFKFDSQGKIVDGQFVVEYSMATKLEDVSQSVDAKWGIPAGAKGRAWKITLREDLKWDDGTPISAKDFVYTMKQQLDPLFKNHRASSYYEGATVIANAWSYVFQGSQDLFAASSQFETYDAANDSKLIFSLGNNLSGVNQVAGFRTTMGFPASYTAAQVATYLKNNYITSLNTDVVASMEGKNLAEIKANAGMKAEWDKIIGWWQTEPDEELDFFLVESSVPAIDFSEVGIFVGDNDYEIVLVLTKTLNLLNDDGSLSFKAAYNMASLPLVKESLYESCKIAPSAGSALWTTNYNTSVATTASFGPYKLASYQAGKEYVLIKNDNWFGYGIDQYKDQYQTDTILCETIAEWNTAWLKFQKGEIDSVGIDVSIASTYKNSSRAFFTPDDYVNSLQLQSSAEGLKNRETAGVNKTILLQQDFRKALSLSIDRAAFAQECTTSSKAGFGLFGPMHYYDVENNGVFRDTEIAKKSLLQVYGFVEKENGTWEGGSGNVYADLDEAYEAITGYNLTLAKELLKSGYDAALAAGDIKAGDKVVLTVGTSTINTSTQRIFDFFVKAFNELVKGTVLEGRFELEFKAFDAAWANDFRAGAYDICTGGWSGAAWDPGYFLLAYLSPDYMYSRGWDTENHEMTLVVPGSNNDEAITMGLLDWYDALNGEVVVYGEDEEELNWGTGEVSEDIRLIIIAALENVILDQAYSVPLTYYYSATLVSFKVDYPTDVYNTFMGYGGIRYRTFNYSEATWQQYVVEQGGTLDYTK